MPIDENHVHTYERVRGKEELYKCCHPDCNYYVKRELIEGKRAICKLCGNDFILTREQLRNKTPRCLACKKTKKERIDNILGDILGV